MHKIWAHKEIDASSEVVWALLTDLERWPDWGPSVRKAELRHERFELGATGTVTTALGPRLGFEITAWEPGARWGWKVAGIDATDHVVKPVGNHRCRVSFGVPLVVAPYLAVVHLALHRIKTLAEKPEVTL